MYTVLVCDSYKHSCSFYSADTVPLLSGEHMFETMALEIEQLLAKVTNSTVLTRYRILLLWHCGSTWA